MIIRLDEYDVLYVARRYWLVGKNEALTEKELGQRIGWKISSITKTTVVIEVAELPSGHVK